jgi:SNF2 family DNA or RNA helicase
VQRHVITFDPIAYPKQWKMMQEIKEYAAVVLTEDVALSVVGKLAELTRLMQALTCPSGIKLYDQHEDGTPNYKKVLYESDVTESIKIDKAIEIIEEALSEGDRVVLFSRFKEALKEVEHRLNDLNISTVRYDGDINTARARTAQLDFDAKTAPNHSGEEDCNSKCPGWSQELADMGLDQTCCGYKYQVFLGQYQKAGTGLNLNAARQMVILDRYYAYAYEDQASGRIQRLNSTKETIVHQIIVTSHQLNKKTVDQWMNDLIETKKNMSEDYDNAHLSSDFMKAIIDGDLI